MVALRLTDRKVSVPPFENNDKNMDYCIHCIVKQKRFEYGAPTGVKFCSNLLRSVDYEDGYL